MHPVFEEMLRARLPLRPDVWRRWQAAIRDEIAPQLDRLEQMDAQQRGKRAKPEAA